MIPPPPISTLFPYTTLFRSPPPEIRAFEQQREQQRQERLAELRRRFVDGPVLRIPGGGDRKSTRLNSSHQIISYAVFCLKKKNKNVNATKPMNTDKSQRAIR